MSVARSLGHGPEAKLIVVHVDDVGMCPAANEGALRALEATATCGSIMVPCPAFDEIAAIARGRDDLDLGVHLTVNAEYADYRWGPVSEGVPGLSSPDGGMWRTSAETQAHASVEEVDRELRAQIDRALDAGIDVTHIDSHMGTVFDTKFIGVYLQLARDYRLPAFMPRVRRETLPEHLRDRLATYVSLVDEIEADGFPIFDHFDSNSLAFEAGTGLDHNTARVAGLGAGLSYLITHCAAGGPELSGITEDWRQRDEEHRIYSDGSMAKVLDEAGVSTIGMRPLRDLIRG